MDINPFNGFQTKTERFAGALVCAVVVPMLSLMTDPDYLRDLLEFVHPGTPDVIRHLIVSALAGFVGFILFSIDPRARAAQEVAHIEIDTGHAKPQKDEDHHDDSTPTPSGP